jgi:hypothetical protein
MHTQQSALKQSAPMRAFSPNNNLCATAAESHQKSGVHMEQGLKQAWEGHNQQQCMQQCSEPAQ